MESMIVAFAVMQICVLPIQLAAWFGLRQENQRKERILKYSLNALGIIAVSRGNRKND